MFNWQSLPTFVAALLFWLLAGYIVTRSPRKPTSILLAVSQVNVVAFLIAQGMQANSPTAEAYGRWERSLEWNVPLGAAIWYWLTVLLLRDEQAPEAQRYLRRIAYP